MLKTLKVLLDLKELRKIDHRRLLVSHLTCLQIIFGDQKLDDIWYRKLGYWCLGSNNPKLTKRRTDQGKCCSQKQNFRTGRENWTRQYSRPKLWPRMPLQQQAPGRQTTRSPHQRANYSVNSLLFFLFKKRLKK